MKPFNKIVAIAYSFGAVGIVALVVFATDIVPLARSPKTILPNIFLGLLALLCIIGVVFVSGRLKEKERAISDRLFLRLLLLGSLIVFVLQVILVQSLTFVDVPDPTDADILVGYATRTSPSDVLLDALNMRWRHYLNTYDEYFSMYPNNHVLLVMFRCISRIAKTIGVDPRFSIAIIGALAINLAAVVTALTIKRLTGKPSVALCSWGGLPFWHRCRRSLHRRTAMPTPFFL